MPGIASATCAGGRRSTISTPIKAEVLLEAGYDDATVQRVRSLIRKQNIKSDPEMQLLEDVICLVFLENYFADFAKDHDEEKLVRILQKTWKKMSARGHQAAMKLQFGDREKAVIAKALASAPDAQAS